MHLWPFRGPAAASRPARDTVPVRPQELLVICHSADAHGQAILENMCAAFEFAKLHFSILDLQRHTTWPELEGFSSVIICTELIWELEFDDARKLQDYVLGGGGMLVAYRCWNEHLAELIGIQQDAPEPEMHLTTGLSFDKEVFPGATGLTVDDSDWLFEHSRYDVRPDELSPDCNILVSDLGGRPILWDRTFGKGKLVYWNTGVLFCRALRGFLIHSVLDTMEVGVSSIAGFAMFHIDDFPTSLSDARLEPVTDEFPELDWNGFFFDVWHRDMMALRAKHDLKYTWYTIMNYHDVDNGPDADLSAPAVTSGHEVLQDRFRHISKVAESDEYGFHGYNHEPLIADVWPDPTTLRSKLELARALWESTVPAPLPTSWVPANNWYGAEHIRALRRVFPEISVVCSLFSSGDAEFGEYREFGPEPWDKSVLCLPRETYGYVLRPELRMMMLSQIGCMGAWTHFIHPDDIYDIPTDPGNAAHPRNRDALWWRNPRADGQTGLYGQLDDWISQVRVSYPWLEFTTTSHAEERYRTHVNNHVEVSASRDEIEIRSESGGLFYAKARTGTSLVAAANGEVVDRRQVENGILHVVKCSAGRAVFQIRTGSAGPAG